MLALNLEKILNSNSDEIEKELDKLKSSEINELATLLRSPSDQSKSEQEQNKINIILKICQETLQKREAEQIRKFGKKLPYQLEVFFEENFPNITSIYDKNKNEATPLSVAIETNNLTVIKEMLSIVPISDFLAHPSYGFALKKVIYRSFCSPEIYNYLIEKIANEGGNKANSIFIEHVSELITDTSELLKNEDNANWKLSVQKMEVLKKYKDKINLVNREENGTNLSSIFSMACDYELGADSDLLLYFLKKEDFNTDSPVAIDNIQKFISSILNSYWLNSANSGVRPSPLGKEEDPKSIEAAKKQLAFLKKLIPFVFSALPEKLFANVKEAIMTEEYPFQYAIISKDIEVVKLFFEYGMDVSLGSFKEILKSDNEEIANLFILYKGKEKFSEFIYKLVGDQHNYSNFNIKLLSLLLKLPLLFNNKEQAKFIQMLEDNKSYFKLNDDFIQQFKNKFAGTLNKSSSNIPEKKVNLDIAVNDKLFGHIHNDHALKGTTLEGSLMEKTAKYLQKFSEDFIQGKIKITGIDPEKENNYKKSLSNIQEKLIDFLKIDALITEVAGNKELQKNLSVADCTEEISNKIIDVLKLKQSILIPGGWIGLNNTTGHAMLYEIKKTEKGYVLLIHNTGSGIRYHTQRQHENGIYYSSVKAYEIPLQNIDGNEDQFKMLLKTLIKPNIIPAYGEESYNADRVYNDITTVTQNLGFQEIDPGLHNKEWTKGQKSGTCTWRVFGSYLKTFPLEEGIDYSDISYEIKRNSLIEYYQTQLQQNRLGEASVQRQLNFALQNLARHIRRLSAKNPPLDEERRHEGLKLIQTVSDALNSNLKDNLKKQKKKRLAQYTPENALQGYKNISPQIATIKSDTYTHNVKALTTENLEIEAAGENARKTFTIKNITINKESILKSLSEMLEQCQQGFKEGYFSSVAKQIEEFYLNLPLERELWLNMPRAQLLESLEMIQKLNSYYLLSQANQNIVPFAAQATVLYTGKIVSDHIIKEYFKNNKAIQQSIIRDSGYPQGADPKGFNFADQLRSPYFVTCNPLHSKKITEIKHHFDENKKLLENDTDESPYLQKIFSNDPLIKKRLLELSNADINFIEKINRDYPNLPEDIKIAQYYLKNRAKIKDQFPELETELKACMHFEKIANELTLYSKGKLDSLVGKNPEENPVDLFTKHSWTYINKNPSTGKYSFGIYPDLNKDHKNNQIFDLDRSQPKLNDSLIQQCLTSESRLNSNQIQTTTQKGEVVSESIAFHRALLNCRADEESQVITTIDLLKKSFHNLEDQNFQNYFFLNLLHSDLLEKQLKETPNVAYDIIKLIERGMKLYSQKNKIKQPALFLLKLSNSLCFLLNKLKDASGNLLFTKELKELEAISNNIPKQIEVYSEKLKSNPSSFDIHTLYQLHSLNLSRIANVYEHSQNLDSTALKQVMDSIFYRKNVQPPGELDPFIEYQAENAKANCFPLLQNYFQNLQTSDVENFNATLNKVIIDRNIELPKEKIQWVGTFPSYRLITEKDNKEIYSINVISGQIFKNHIQFLPLPPVVYNNPLYTKFFKEKSIMASANADQTIFEFTINKIKYRFSIKPNDKDRHPTGVLFKEIEIDGKKQWYEYNSVCPNLDLPVRLMEQGNTNWVSVLPNEAGSQETIIMNEQSQTKLCKFDSHGIVTEIDKTGNATGFKLYNTARIRDDKISILSQQRNSQNIIDQYPFLTHFEDIRFIEFWKKDSSDHKSDEIIIKLPRYGLEFTQKIYEDGTRGDIVWSKDPRYKIKISDIDLIPNFKAALILEGVSGLTTENTRVEDIAIIPKQQFIATNIPEAEYYRLHFDTNAEVRKRRLVYDGGYRPYELDDNFELQKFSNQERYAIYKVSNAMELQPTTTEDRFYLAYLYLAKRQPLLALETLDDALKEPFTLNIEQLEWLRRIMLDIPARLNGPPAEQFRENEARIDSPEFLAVRALAASILAKQRLKFKDNIIFPREDSSGSHLRSANQDYQNLVNNKLKDFWNSNNLSQEIISAYDKYSKIQNQVPGTGVSKISGHKYAQRDGMRLHMKEERDILKYCSQFVKTLPAHLQHRKRKISLEYLNLQRIHLEAHKAKAGAKFPKALQQRLDLINKKIGSKPSVKATHTEIQNVNMPLKPNASVSFIYPSQRALLNNNLSIMVASKVTPDKLKYNTSENDFIYSFNDYYNLAKNALSGGEQRDKLNHALLNLLYVAAIKNSTKITLSIQENLSIILAYVYKYPDFFPEGPITTENLQTIVEHVHKLISDKKVVTAKVNTIVEVVGEITVAPSIIQAAEPLKIDTNIIVPTQSGFEVERKKFLEIYQKESKKATESKDVLEGITVTSDMEKIKQTLYREILTDYENGTKKNEEIFIRNKSALAFCDSLSDKGVNLLNKLREGIAAKSKSLEALKTTILELANKPPTDAKSFVEWNLQREAQLRSDLSFEQILHLFLMQDKTVFKNATALNDEDITQLNAHIYEFLANATEIQHNERLENEVKKLSDPKITKEKLTNAINQIGLLLSVERCYNPVENPEILLFEYLDNKLLHPEQYAYLKDLLKNDESGYQSQVVQLIMGGGKSKVLLPLLALKKANGTNLSIIEVPDALFQINKADLGSTTQKLFGLESHDFYFDDSIVCSIEYLKTIRSELRSIILNHEYLITTKESMQSFELKYIKFLKFMDESNPENIEKAKLFSDIIRIFKYQGDALIDEIDSTLDVRKQLIYTVGRGEAVPKHELQAILDLHLFFDKVNIPLESAKKPDNESGEVSLKEIFLGLKTPAKHEWKNVFEALGQALIRDKSSPLAEIINKILEGEEKPTRTIKKQILYRYLIGAHQTVPDFINNLTDAEKDKIAIYKEELTSILPLTLKKNLEEHFGLSKDDKKTDNEKEIAIPFMASNTPNERSKFGNYLETVNYTLRIQLSKPLSVATIRNMVQSFKNQEEETLKFYFGRAKPINFESPADKFFKLTGVPLEEIDVENLDTLITVHETGSTEPKSKKFIDHVLNSQAVKEYCLMNHILNNIEKNTEILTSDAQNHTRQFRSVQGMTGTDWNYRTYPSFIKPNKTVSLGSDGQTRNHLLRDPYPVHLLETAISPSEKLATMLKLFNSHPNQKTLHAWIDLGAYFKGISNRIVADNFSRFFANNPNFSHLKYILFFGPDDKLYALPTHPTADKVEPRLLERTDPDYIKATLGCGPESIFTYYDQRRITGTDIKQDADAHAFVPIGLKTLDRDLLQAVMRMRDLKNEQRVEFIVPNEVKEAYPNIKKWDVNTVMRLCIDNQVERLAEDHFRSALQKMRSIIRNDLFEKILEHNTNPLLQKKLMTKFDKVFFSLMTKSAFEQYGNIKEQEQTTKVLNELADSIFKEWQTLLTEANIASKDDESKQFREELNQVVNSSIEICYKEVAKLQSDFEASLTDTEVEVEKEEETEKAEELEQETDYHFQAGAEPLTMPSLSTIDFNRFTLEAEKNIGGLGMKTLESMAKEGLTTTMANKKLDKRNWEFSPNILVSKNFAHTYREQANAVDAYKKEAIFFLVEQDDKTNEVKFLLITPEEASQLSKELSGFDQSGNKHFWIETTHETLRAGKKPEKLPESYSKGVEQIALSNNDTDVLYNLMSDKSWLREKPDEKLEYLERVIRPIHKDKVDMLAPLRFKVEQTFEMQDKTLLTAHKRTARKASASATLKAQPAQKPKTS